jgi:hypothetical protein
VSAARDHRGVLSLQRLLKPFIWYGRPGNDDGANEQDWLFIH